MLNKNYEVFIGCEAEFDAAEIVLFGAPYDSTASYRPGARFGCRAIRAESYGLETYSPYQDRDLTERNICDSGDIELPFGDSAAALDMIEGRAAEILHAGKIPFMLGGEHLVAFAAVRAAYAKYPALHIIHFDAHTDLRDAYLGVKLSHACVMRRCWDMLGDGRIWQFGIRSGDKPEFAWAAAGHTHLQKFDFSGLADVLQRLSGQPVYFSLDLDVLDPAYLPGTGTPEAGGVTFRELLDAALAVCQNANVVALDVNELAPNLDASGVSTAVAGKLVRELLLAI